MMTYKEFKEMAEKKILEFAPEEYQGRLSFESNRVNKVNMTLDAMVFSCDSISGDTEHKIHPTIYIDQMYQDYAETGDFEATMKKTILSVIDSLQRKVSVPKLNLETLQNRIVYRLINTAQNSELLTTVPNRPFLDLSIVYYWVDEGKNDYKESILITNKLAQHLGVSEDGLYELAKENTCRIFPTVIESLLDVLRSLSDGAECFPTEINKNLTMIMWTLTNKDNFHGAAAMLDNACLSHLASVLESDYFILPSSIHELIAVPITEAIGTPEQLADMVHEINLSLVKPTERLSNQVYRYDRAADKVILATDTKNKLLDDDIAV